MVKKYWLIITNGLVWGAAGINIARIGIVSAIENGTMVWLFSIIVFAAFGTMFFRIIAKNTQRIQTMECEEAPIYKFLTVKGYIIIAVMMTMGITLRHIDSIPNGFFAFFYTGLGCALALAGLHSIFKLILKKTTTLQ